MRGPAHVQRTGPRVRVNVGTMSLSKKDIESLRHALESKRADLVRAHGEHLHLGTRSEEKNFPDPMDAATRAEEEAERLGLAHQERNLLAEIDRALAKID